MDQYREGKVKSTPMRGVKENLKPNAYKQWERVRPRRTLQMSGIRDQGSELCTASKPALILIPDPCLLTSEGFAFGEPVTAYLLHNGSAS